VRIVVAGGAGFLGSHLSDALAARGDSVVVLDDLSSGSLDNISQLVAAGHEFIQCDVSKELPNMGHVDGVFNLASPASPPHYLRHPLETLAVGSEGTRRLLELADASGARFLQASTSEVYGDPLVHPQPESYWGNVNPVGPRSVYDEAKRFGETIVTAYRTAKGTNTTIARIFNTYGPRLDPGDGRVVSNFMYQALTGADLTIYGDGTQTRSLTFVADEVRGLIALFDSNHSGPMNLGGQIEQTILEIAETILQVTGSNSQLVFQPLPVDDPTRRRPDISLAREILGWEPTTSLSEGLSALRDDYVHRHIVPGVK
jgi:dTDP-glucose 4,6-dehydratase